MLSRVLTALEATVLEAWRAMMEAAIKKRRNVFISNVSFHVPFCSSLTQKRFEIKETI